MTETQQVENEVVETPTEPESTVTESQNSDDPIAFIEQKARESGWKPKEEFDGDESQWKPAHEFVLSSIDIYKKEKVKQQKANKAYKNLLEMQAKNHSQKVDLLQSQLSNAINEKEQALESYDTDTVRKKDAEIEKVKDALRELKDPAQEIKQQQQEAVNQFREQNPEIFKSTKSAHDFQYYADKAEKDLAAQGYTFQTPDEITQYFDYALGLYRKDKPLKNQKPNALAVSGKSAAQGKGSAFDKVSQRTQRDILYIVSSNKQIKPNSAEFKAKCEELAKKIGN